MDHHRIVVIVRHDLTKQSPAHGALERPRKVADRAVAQRSSSAMRLSRESHPRPSARGGSRWMPTQPLALVRATLGPPLVAAAD